LNLCRFVDQKGRFDKYEGESLRRQTTGGRIMGTMPVSHPQEIAVLDTSNSGFIEHCFSDVLIFNSATHQS